jgi:hypothetical protein
MTVQIFLWQCQRQKLGHCCLSKLDTRDCVHALRSACRMRGNLLKNAMRIDLTDAIMGLPASLKLLDNAWPHGVVCWRARRRALSPVTAVRGAVGLILSL